MGIALNVLKSDDGRCCGQTQRFNARRETRFTRRCLSSIEYLNTTRVEASVDDVGIVKIPRTTPHLRRTFTSSIEEQRRQSAVDLLR